MLKRFENEVYFLYYPFALNPTSDMATQVALCAGEQGKFWDVHRLLFIRQAGWHQLKEPLPVLLDIAKAGGADIATVQRCVDSGRMRPLIEADKAYARSLQVRSTPTLFINEQRIVGAQPEGDLVRVIRQELDRARRSPQ